MLTGFHIVLAMKPVDGNFSQNAIKHGVAGINIEACRIGLANEKSPVGSGHGSAKSNYKQVRESEGNTEWNRTPSAGRFPANLILDDSKDVKALFPETTSGSHKPHKQGSRDGFNTCEYNTFENRGDSGSASRFFKQVNTGD